MGSLKTLAIAGAVAMIATSAAPLAPAFAADLIPPPMMAPPPPPMDMGGNGFYLRGDIGVGVQSTKGFRQDEVTAAGGSWLRSSMGDPATVGVGVGYQINNFIRFDVTGEYRSKVEFKGVDRYSYTCTFAAGSCAALGNVIQRGNVWSGSHGAFVALVNGYIDLGTWNGLTPFVGAGVGGAYHMVKGVRDYDPSDLGGGGFSDDRSKWNLAWALHAGLAYDVTQNVKLELGYRYLNMGHAQSGGMNCISPSGAACNYGPLKIRSIDSHDFRLGMRWALGGSSAPMMAAAPLVRKY